MRETSGAVGRAKGPVAIVAGTGGLLAPAFASRSATLVFVGPDAAEIGRAVAGASSAGLMAAGFVGDPSEDAVRQGVVELALELFGRVDLVGDGGGGSEVVGALAGAVAGIVGRPIEIVASSDDAEDLVFPG